MADIRDDLAVIANSLRMLPPWDAEHWWSRWADIDPAFGRRCLGSKLWMIVDTLHPGTSDNERLIYDACRYLLLFFDHQQLYEHLDDAVGGMHWARPGQAGQRWAETICAATWRVLLATAPAGGLGAEQIRQSAGLHAAGGSSQLSTGG